MSSQIFLVTPDNEPEAARPENKFAYLCAETVLTVPGATRLLNAIACALVTLPRPLAVFVPSEGSIGSWQ